MVGFQDARCDMCGKKWQIADYLIPDCIVFHSREWSKPWIFHEKYAWLCEDCIQKLADMVHIKLDKGDESKR
jgi:hypothetical protein